jgi:thiol-disulfide isomerase/thioredoxin
VGFRVELIRELVMKKLAVILAIVLALGLVVSGCPGNSGQNGIALGRITGIDANATQPPQTDQPAPDFYFENPEGEPTSLGQLKGQTVMVNFWATWCSPCTYEMPFLQQIYEDWPEDTLVLLAINIQESSSDVSQFMQSQGFSFPVLLDSKGNVARRYNVTGIPTTFFIDKENVIQNVHVGSFQSQAEIETILSKID